jgi:hypothetical protein
MPGTTDTTANPSPSGFFALSAFGAVTLVKKTTVTIPPDVAAALAEVPGILATMESTYKIHLDLRARKADATEQDAEDFRNYIRAYAELHNLNPYLPKHAPAHWTRKDADKDASFRVTETDPETNAPVAGTITEKNGTVVPVKWIPDNKVDPTWNVGHDIHFRLTVKKPAAENANGEVTVTQGTPQPARRRTSRGQQILNRN